MVPRSAGSGRADSPRFEQTRYRPVDKLDDLARRAPRFAHAPSGV